jgi:hypothetical protein
VKKEEARRAVLAEWRAWVAANGKTNPNGMDGLMFFSDISREKSHLLQFKTSGDPWQDVHGWLLRDRLVSD